MNWQWNIEITIKIKPKTTTIFRIMKKLTCERKKEINEKVDSLMLEKQMTEPGFDLIAKLTDPKTFSDRRPFQIVTQTLDEDTTGILLVDDNNNIPNTNTHKLIAINTLLQSSQDYRKRRRFIIAHEYGHYILHKQNDTQYAHRDTRNKNDIIEQEADYFARCLLMPEKFINQVLKLNFAQNLDLEGKADLISRLFNVTKKKAYQRLDEDLHIA